MLVDETNKATSKPAPSLPAPPRQAGGSALLRAGPTASPATVSAPRAITALAGIPLTAPPGAVISGLALRRSVRTPQTRLAPPLRRGTTWPAIRATARPIPETLALPGSDATLTSNDASTVNAPAVNHWHGALSAQRLPGPRLTPQRRLFPGRSPRQSSANAARGGLRPPPEGRSRGATKPSSSAQHDKKIT